jgi:hypothetical protein
MGTKNLASSVLVFILLSSTMLFGSEIVYFDQDSWSRTKKSILELVVDPNASDFQLQLISTQISKYTSDVAKQEDNKKRAEMRKDLEAFLVQISKKFSWSTCFTFSTDVEVLSILDTADNRPKDIRREAYLQVLHSSIFEGKTYAFDSSNKSEKETYTRPSVKQSLFERLKFCRKESKIGVFEERKDESQLNSNKAQAQNVMMPKSKTLEQELEEATLYSLPPLPAPAPAKKIK